jgi:hypothetical protein
MAGKTLITFAQEGETPITFEVSANMMSKIYSKIQRINDSAVLGKIITGAAEWWMMETSEKMIRPILDEFPDPDPVGVSERMVQIQELTAEIADLKRAAFVVPVVPVVPPATPTEAPAQ